MTTDKRYAIADVKTLDKVHVRVNTHCEILLENYYRDKLKLTNWGWITHIGRKIIFNKSPFSTSNMTDCFKYSFIRECRENPIYFFSRVLHTNSPSNINIPGNKGNRFAISKASAAKIFLELYHNKSVIDFCSRRSNRTTTSLGIILYKLLFRRDETIYVLADTAEEVVNMIDELNYMVDNLPKYFNTLNGVITKARSISNGYMVHNNNNSRVFFKYLNGDLRFAEYKDNKDRSDHIASYYSTLFNAIGVNHIFIKNSSNYITDIGSFYNKLHTTLPEVTIDIVNTMDNESETIKNVWDNYKHWDDTLIDNMDSIKDNDLIVLHYEPQYIMDKIKLIHLYESILNLKNKDIRNILSIDPFSTDYRLSEWLARVRLNK